MNIFQEVFGAESASEERTENGGEIQGFANSFTCDSISPPLWAPSAPVGGHIIYNSQIFIDTSESIWPTDIIYNLG